MLWATIVLQEIIFAWYVLHDLILLPAEPILHFRCLPQLLPVLLLLLPHYCSFCTHHYQPQLLQQLLLLPIQRPAAPAEIASLQECPRFDRQLWECRR
jgi:hypothetical protein